MLNSMPPPYNCCAPGCETAIAWCDIEKLCAKGESTADGDKIVESTSVEDIVAKAVNVALQNQKENQLAKACPGADCLQIRPYTRRRDTKKTWTCDQV